MTKKKESIITHQSYHNIETHPTVVVSKYTQDYSSNDTIDEECDVSHAYKLQKEEKHQDVEEHVHTTTICNLKYMCISQKKEI